MTASRFAFLAACAFSLCAPSFARDPLCHEGEAINDCIDRLVIGQAADLRKKEAASEEVAAANDVAEEEAQAGSASSGAQARSTITDLVPWLNMLGMLSDSDASDGTIAVDLNFLLPTQKSENTKHNSQLKLAVDVSPEPFEPLIAAIPEDVRAERTKDLDEKISDTGDSELQFTYSVVNDKLGRDFRRHEPKLAALVASRIRVSSSPGQKARLDGAKLAFHAAFQKWLSDNAVNPDQPIPADMNPDLVAQFEKIIEEKGVPYAAELARRLDEVKTLINQDDMTFLTGLVLQQPQLLFSANQKFRDELVGPESWGAKITYERSFVSLSHFFKKTKSCTAVAADPTGTQVAAQIVNDCFKDLHDYADAHAEDIENESRWLASLEYKEVDSWQYALPTDGVAIDRPKYDRLIASAGFGRAVRRSAVKDRVDFVAAYDSNLDDDDNYKSRFVVTLTYTRRFGEMDIPFSIVYANKSEFLEGTDKQIGLHIGLKYRALDKEQ